MRTELAAACLMAIVMAATAAQAEITTLSCIMSGTINKNDKIENISKSEAVVKIVIGAEDLTILYPELSSNYPKIKIEKIIQFTPTFTQGAIFVDNVKNVTNVIGNQTHLVIIDENYIRGTSSFKFTDTNAISTAAIMIDRNSGLLEFTRSFQRSDADINYFYSEEVMVVGNCSLNKSRTKKF